MTIYTPNVPQATQTIAFTQPLIQSNFTYVNTAMQVDHVWSDNLANTPADGSHQKLSMPSLADPAGALPTGITGIIYTSSFSRPKYYDNTQVAGKFLTTCNAYIQFKGTGANGALNAGGNAVNSFYNVDGATSVKTGTGLYTITFTNALPSANYGVLVTGMRGGSAGECFGFVQSDGTTVATNMTTTFVKVGFQSSGGTARDVLIGTVYLFGV